MSHSQTFLRVLVLNDPPPRSHNATLRYKFMLEERLKELVTPDKVLRYYNVPRGSRVTHAGAAVVGLGRSCLPRHRMPSLLYTNVRQSPRHYSHGEHYRNPLPPFQAGRPYSL